jgi:WD40 repeat protein
VLRLWDLSEKREELRSVGHLGKSAMALAARAPVAAWTTPSPRLTESSQRIDLRSSPEVAILDETEGHRALVFDLARNEQRFLVSGHMGAIHALAFSDDGKRLASGDSVGTLKLWDAETGAELLSMEGHLNAIDGLAFHPSGRQLASIGSDGVVRIWFTD